MLVTKLLIFPVEIRIFCPKTTKNGPKLAFLVNLGQVMQAYSMPCCGLVCGCGARAVSCKTPIYFVIYSNEPKENHFHLPKAGSDTWTSDRGLLASEGQKGDETELMCPFLSLSFLSFAVVG